MGVMDAPGEGINGSLAGLPGWSINVSSLSGNHSDLVDWDSMFPEDPSKTPAVRAVFILVYSIVFACCFVGNILVIFVVLRHRKMRTITNFFLANLAVADLCVGIFCVLPSLSKYLSPYWVLGRVMCKLYYCVQAASYVAAITILSVISVERYFAILHPLRSKQLTTIFLLRVVVAVVWTIAASCGIPYLIIYDTVSVSNVTFCLGSRPYNAKAYVTGNFVLWYLLPLCLMTVMYSRISVVLWRTSKTDNLHHPGESKGCSSAGLRQVQDSGKISLHNKRNDGKISHIPLQSVECNTTASSDECEYDPAIKSCKYTFNTNASQNTSIQGKSYSMSDGDSEDEPPSEYTALDFEDDWPTDKKKSSKTSDDLNQSSKNDIRLKRVFNTTYSPSIPTIKTTPPRDEVHSHGNGHMLKKQGVHRQVKFLINRPHKKVPNNALMARRRVIRLLITVIVSFALCVLPYHIVMLVQNWKSNDSPSFSDYLVSPISSLICYFNSGLNPILYAFLSDNFRRSLRDLLTRSRPKGLSHRGNRSTLSGKTLNSSL